MGLLNSLFHFAGSRRANLHLVHTLLGLANTPQLLLLGARKPDVGAASGTVPTLLSVLVAKNHAFTTTEALTIQAVLVVGYFTVNAVKVAHVSVTVTLLRLLRRLAHPAELVGVLARVEADTLVLDRAEHARWAVVLVKVGLLLLHRLVFVLQVSLSGFQSLAGGAYKVGLCTGLDVVRKHAVLNHPDTDGFELGVDELAEGVG